MIDRHHLQILLQVEQSGSLTAAAEQLHLSQSALSHAIKKLEGRLGVSLWVKQGRKVQLTQAGLFLLAQAQRLLPQFERMEDTLKGYANGQQGVLRIGIECHPCYRWLLSMIEDYLSQWPQVDVDVVEQIQSGGLASLYHHEIDVLVTPDPVRRSGLTFHPVFAYEQVLVVSKQHELADKPYVQAADLSDQLLYTYPVEVERLDVFQQMLIPAQVLPKKHKTVESTELLLQLVAANRGVCTLPRWILKEHQQHLGLCGIPLGKSGIHKHIYLGVRSEQDAPAYVGAFIDLANRD